MSGFRDPEAVLVTEIPKRSDKMENESDHDADFLRIPLDHIDGEAYVVGAPEVTLTWRLVLLYSFLAALLSKGEWEYRHEDHRMPSQKRYTEREDRT